MLHRALVNAGDFLIRDRTLRMLERHRPDLTIALGKAWVPLASQFDTTVLVGRESRCRMRRPGLSARDVSGPLPFGTIGRARSAGLPDCPRELRDA